MTLKTTAAIVGVFFVIFIPPIIIAIVVLLRTEKDALNYFRKKRLTRNEFTHMFSTNKRNHSRFRASVKRSNETIPAPSMPTVTYPYGPSLPQFCNELPVSPICPGPSLQGNNLTVPGLDPRTHWRTSHPLSPLKRVACDSVHLVSKFTPPQSSLDIKLSGQKAKTNMNLPRQYQEEDISKLSSFLHQPYQVHIATLHQKSLQPCSPVYRFHQPQNTMLDLEQGHQLPHLSRSSHNFNLAKARLNTTYSVAESENFGLREEEYHNSLVDMPLPLFAPADRATRSKLPISSVVSAQSDLKPETENMVVGVARTARMSRDVVRILDIKSGEIWNETIRVERPPARQAKINRRASTIIKSHIADVSNR